MTRSTLLIIALLLFSGCATKEEIRKIEGSLESQKAMIVETKAGMESRIEEVHEDILAVAVNNRNSHERSVNRIVDLDRRLEGAEVAVSHQSDVIRFTGLQEVYDRHKHSGEDVRIYTSHEVDDLLDQFSLTQERRLQGIELQAKGLDQEVRKVHDRLATLETKVSAILEKAVRPEDLPDAVRNVFQELSLLTPSGVTQEEFEKLQEQLNACVERINASEEAVAKVKMVYSPPPGTPKSTTKTHVRQSSNWYWGGPTIITGSLPPGGRRVIHYRRTYPFYYVWPATPYAQY